MKKIVLVTLIALAGFAVSAKAQVLGVSVGPRGFAVGVGAPVCAAPPVVYSAPPAVVYSTPPAYYAPPVVYPAAPCYTYGPTVVIGGYGWHGGYRYHGYGWHHGGWHH